VADAVFPHLVGVRIEQVAREGGTVLISGRSRGVPVRCPACGTVTGKVHAYYRRRLVDVPASGTAVVLELTLLRLVCGNYDCPRQIFHEQIPGRAERYARRTSTSAKMVTKLAIARAGRPAAALLAAAGLVLSRTAVPAVVGVDDFALARSRRYAAIDAVTRDRIEVLPDLLAVTFEAWLRAHAGVTAICRDRSTALAAGARDSENGYSWHGYYPSPRESWQSRSIETPAGGRSVH
jgi:transposase